MSSSRQKVREAAFLLSFEKLFREDSLEDIFKFAREVDDFTFNAEAEELVRQVEGKKDELDEIVAMFSDKRAVNRIPRVNLAILRIAIYEAMYDKRVPVNVAISEAVRLTQMYALEPDVSFVNGVLGSFSKSEYVKNEEEDKR
ncbi:transcription antitermination factor NusB [Ruminococcus sp. FC2018]|uniref:transcription antitermination factor NusB n=1 Tax=Ruminococcus sp. FC2018 TaxID=1410617 RepID=UPI00055A4741|nr:transcription antitermination factor NusB [Ruminococcus sp. FC2018]